MSSPFFLAAAECQNDGSVLPDLLTSKGQNRGLKPALLPPGLDHHVIWICRDKPFSTFYECICSHFPFLVLWRSEKGSDLPVGGPDVHQVRRTPLGWGLLTSLRFFMTDPKHLRSRKPHGHLQRKWAHNIQQLGSERHFKLIVFNNSFF